MAEVPKSFPELMARVKAGCEAATAELVRRYSRYVFQAVRGTLDPKLRTEFDSADFTQAVWASVCAHRSRLDQFHTQEELIAFLRRVATNKVINQYRRRRARRVRLALELHVKGSEGGEILDTFPGRQPTPSQFAIAEETRQRLVQHDPELCERVMELRLAGLTFKEIGQEVGLHEASVRRIVRKMEERLEREERAGDGRS